MIHVTKVASSDIVISKAHVSMFYSPLSNISLKMSWDFYKERKVKYPLQNFHSSIWICVKSHKHSHHWKYKNKFNKIKRKEKFPSNNGTQYLLLIFLASRKPFLSYFIPSICSFIWKENFLSQTCPIQIKTIVIYLLQMERLKFLTRRLFSSSPETPQKMSKMSRTNLMSSPPPAPLTPAVGLPQYWKCPPIITLNTSLLCHQTRWKGSEETLILKVESFLVNAKWRWRNFSPKPHLENSGCPCTFIATFSGNTSKGSQSLTRLSECTECWVSIEYVYYLHIYPRPSFPFAPVSLAPPC